MTQIDSNIQRAKEFLLLDELVAIPTETVYGLAANAFSETAIQKIFELKNRPRFNPLIVHIASVDRLKEVAIHISPLMMELAAAFWPGPLTLLVDKKDTISSLVTAGSDRVAVRIPNHPLTLELLKQLPFPVAAPSANPFMSISPTQANHVKQYFDGKLHYILDGGICQKGIESTIIGFRDNQAVLYREGSCDLDEIEKITGPLVRLDLEDSKIEAPGMLKKHYAPQTKLRVTTDIVSEVQFHKGKKIGLLTLKPQPSIAAVSVQLSLSENGDLNQAAKNLYAHLIQLDALNLDLIITEFMPETGIGNAINDKLKRASHP